MHHMNKENHYESEYYLQLSNHVIADYKLEIVRQNLQHVMRQLQDPALKQNPTQQLEILTELKQLTEAEQKLKLLQGGGTSD